VFIVLFAVCMFRAPLFVCVAVTFFIARFWETELQRQHSRAEFTDDLLSVTVRISPAGMQL
jgi:hypothetical protein